MWRLAFVPRGWRGRGGAGVFVRLVMHVVVPYPKPPRAIAAKPDRETLSPRDFRNDSLMVVTMSTVESTL
jgi:hypothetical protein